MPNPLSLHRYLYASDDPVNRDDPGGMDDHKDVLNVIKAAYLAERPDSVGFTTFGSRQYYADYHWLGPPGLLTGKRALKCYQPDVFDANPAYKIFMELKPIPLYKPSQAPLSLAVGLFRISEYQAAYGASGFLPETAWQPPFVIPAGGKVFYARNILGLMLYTDNEGLRKTLETADVGLGIGALWLLLKDIQIQSAFTAARGLATVVTGFLNAAVPQVAGTATLNSSMGAP